LISERRHSFGNNRKSGVTAELHGLICWLDVNDRRLVGLNDVEWIARSRVPGERCSQ
jgi:hypothetical protein